MVGGGEKAADEGDGVVWPPPGAAGRSKSLHRVAGVTLLKAAGCSSRSKVTSMPERRPRREGVVMTPRNLYKDCIQIGSVRF